MLESLGPQPSELENVPALGHWGLRFPIVFAEWSPRNSVQASEVAAGSHYKAIWECVYKHEWTAQVGNRTGSSNTGCPVCANKVVLAGFNDLAFRFPDVAVEWSSKNSRKADEVISGSHYRAIWECVLNHEWEATVGDRTGYNTGCPVCTNKVVLAGFNDVAFKFPGLADEWSDKNVRKADEVLFGSHAKVIWECAYDHEWTATVVSRAIAKTGCPVCANKVLVVGFNDLAFRFPDVASEWSAKNVRAADEVFFGSNLKVAWECSVGHEWATTIVNRTFRGDGCPKCSLGNSSKIEVRFFEELQLLFPDAENGSRITLALRKHKTLSADILFEADGRKVVVEFDGDYWHRIRSDRSEMDRGKTEVLLAAGYTVVRIRGGNLPHLDLSHSNLFQISHSEAKGGILATVASIMGFLNGLPVNRFP